MGVLQTLGEENVTFYPRGGHLGNLHEADVQADVMEALADLRGPQGITYHEAIGQAAAPRCTAALATDPGDFAMEGRTVLWTASRGLPGGRWFLKRGYGSSKSGVSIRC